jgi:hypothetical protein
LRVAARVDSESECKQGEDALTDKMQRREFMKLSALVSMAATGGTLGRIDSAFAAPTEKTVTYQVSGKSFDGMIVYDGSVQTKRPVIFMQPDWYGVNTDNIAQARLIAGKDYVVLMADMFGTGYANKTKARPELAAAVGAVHNDLAFTLACGNAAYDALSAEANKLGIVDGQKKVAIG